MPHNRTRLWVGLAIIAVTIPAVGTYYTHAAATSDLKGNPISAAGRIDLASLQQYSFGSGRLALHQPLRDYQSEVNAALARQGVYPDQRFANDENYDTYDDLFDIDPLATDTDRFGRVSTQDVPDPATLLAPGSPNLVAYSTDGPVTAGDSVAANTAAIQNGSTRTSSADDGSQTAMATSDANSDATGDYLQSGTMSDSDVYRLVVANMSGTQRDDFVRAYAVMSAEQRADLLDGFRQQMQGGQ